MNAVLGPLSFGEKVTGHPIGYIRIEEIEGTRTCILVDEDGEEVALSEYGTKPLISFAYDNGWEVLTVH